jgi:hypothetical protein
LLVDTGLGQASEPIDKVNDLRAVYDAYRNRFWVAGTAGSSHWNNPLYPNIPTSHWSSRIFIAVSKSADPTQGWYQYCYDAVAQWGVPNSVWQVGDNIDYPLLGIGPQSVIVTNPVVNSTSGAKVLRYYHVTFHSADALKDGQGDGGWEFWDLKTPDGSTPGRIQPAVHHGSSTYEYLVGQQGNPLDSLVVWGVKMDWGNPSANLVYEAAVQTPVSWSEPMDAPQLGSTQSISMTNLGNSPLKAIYRNSYLYVVTHDAFAWQVPVVPPGGPGPNVPLFTAVRLVRLPLGNFPTAISNHSAAGFINTFLPSNESGDPNPTGALLYYGWPAVEVNQHGDMVVVYNRSGTTIYPEVCYSAYLHNESGMRPSRVLKVGEQAYAIPNPPPPLKPVIPPLPWGDIAGACVDPDDTSIWIAQQYASTPANPPDPNGNYDIYVGQVIP